VYVWQSSSTHTVLNPWALRSAKKLSAAASERLTITECGESPMSRKGALFWSTRYRPFALFLTGYAGDAIDAAALTRATSRQRASGRAIRGANPRREVFMLVTGARLACGGNGHAWES
jgi:hypothetical protein